VKYVFKGTLDFDVEDGGAALIAEAHGDNPRLFVRLQSWDDEEAMHPELLPYEGREFTVTVEIEERVQEAAT
jgi:hypothetical protein